jgi:hypothetical protein
VLKAPETVVASKVTKNSPTNSSKASAIAMEPKGSNGKGKKIKLPKNEDRSSLKALDMTKAPKGGNGKGRTLERTTTREDGRAVIQSVAPVGSNEQIYFERRSMKEQKATNVPGMTMAPKFRKDNKRKVKGIKNSKGSTKAPKGVKSKGKKIKGAPSGSTKAPNGSNCKGNKIKGVKGSATNSSKAPGKTKAPKGGKCKGNKIKTPKNGPKNSSKAPGKTKAPKSGKTPKDTVNIFSGAGGFFVATDAGSSHGSADGSNKNVPGGSNTANTSSMQGTDLSLKSSAMTVSYLSTMSSIIVMVMAFFSYVDF